MFYSRTVENVSVHCEVTNVLRSEGIDVSRELFREDSVSEVTK